MMAITEIKLIMWTSIVDEEIESRTQTRILSRFQTGRIETHTVQREQHRWR